VAGEVKGYDAAWAHDAHELSKVSQGELTGQVLKREARVSEVEGTVSEQPQVGSAVQNERAVIWRAETPGSYEHFVGYIHPDDMSEVSCQGTSQSAHATTEVQRLMTTEVDPQFLDALAQGLNLCYACVKKSLQVLAIRGVKNRPEGVPPGELIPELLRLPECEGRIQAPLLHFFYRGHK